MIPLRPGTLVRNTRGFESLVIMKDKPRRNDVWNEAEMAGEFRKTYLGLIIVSDLNWALVFVSGSVGWCRACYLQQVTS